MRNFLDLVSQTLNFGTAKLDRTGTGTFSLVAPQLRFDLNAGFPLVTTSKKHLRSIIHELLWFLRGSSDNNELNAERVTIWDEWATTEDHTRMRTLTQEERIELAAEKMGKGVAHIRSMMDYLDGETYRKASGDQNGSETWLQQMGIPTEVAVEHIPAGSLGPIYGVLWRAWPNPDGTTHDQLAELMENLRKRPFSRRHIISGWNPSVLPDESISPQENVKRGRQALAACHTLFQFIVEPMNFYQRVKWAVENKGDLAGEDGWMNAESLDAAGVPDKRISCVLFQRSADIMLGVPYNIASYSLLTMMIAQQLNFALGEFVNNYGDAHIYSNHVEGAKEQLEREPHPLPSMRFARKPDSIFDYEFSDFVLENYDPHPTIKFPISV